MRILLLGEYSNVHWTLAEGLRSLGHKVTVMSNGDYWKNYPRDIDVARRDSRFGGLSLYIRLLALLPRMRGYDVVRLINPMFLELKAERFFFFYNYLRRHNGKIVLGAYGMDYYWAYVNAHQKPLRYSDFNIGDTQRNDPTAMKDYNDWVSTAKERLNKYIAADCDAMVAALYEYKVTYDHTEFKDKTTFIPLPIKIAHPSEVPAAKTGVTADRQDKLRVFVGISRARSSYKGTDIMLRSAQRIAEKWSDRVELLVAEGLPFEEYKRMYARADIILDQLYA